MSKHVFSILSHRAVLPVASRFCRLVYRPLCSLRRNLRSHSRTWGCTTDPAATRRSALPVPANPKLPTLFLVGDSTVRNGHADGGKGQWGWGEPLVDLFDTTKINVDNRAIGGRSSRSYIMEKQWAETLALVKPGDVILFQWGHNDDGPLDDPARARGTLHGIGDETKEVDNPILKIHETVHTYGWYLRKYVADT